MKYVTKKLLILTVLVSAFCTVLFSSQAHATVVPEACYTFDSPSGTITDYDTTDLDCMLDPEIPSVIGGESVLGIGADAFNNKGLVSVVIPSSIITIGASAFKSNELTSVFIPVGVTEIGNSAFTYNQLTSLSIPSSVTSLGNNSFEYNKLTSVNIPSSITVVSDYAFSNNLLTTVVVPEGITAIGGGAFLSNQLTSVTLPQGLTIISEDSFSRNRLISIEIPDTVTIIGAFAFINNQLTSVTLPNSVANIGVAAFAVQNSIGSSYFDEFSSGDPSRIQAAQDATWYVQLFTEDSTNPNNTTDELFLESDAGGDFSGDGDTTDSLGGHIVNPASVRLEYKSPSGIEILAPSTVTGMGINNYIITSNPGNDPTLYYRIGQAHSFSAPAIAGYTTPSAVQLALSTSENSHTFVYQANGSQSQVDGSSGDGLASTGLNIVLLSIIGTTLFVGGLLYIMRAPYYKQR